MNGIFNVFAPSPIRPIEQHMHRAYHCAKQLSPFFECVLQAQWDKAELLKAKISEMEREADVIKRNLRLHLPTGLFLPVARTDLLELLSAQDKIANKAQDIANLVFGRKMTIPAEIQSILMSFLMRCLDAAKQACKAINELDQLLETGFRGNEVSIVEDMIVTLDEIEHDCDDQLSEIRRIIFTFEKNLPPVDVIFLYKVVQWIGDLADHAQIVGGRLQILIAR